MASHAFTFHKADFVALPSGILWWPSRRILTVSDLHLGKSDRFVRRAGIMLPPYETKDTLTRLFDCIEALNPLTVICLGDSFDDLAAQDAISAEDEAQLTGMMAGRRWVWIEGNHDPGPLSLGGTHLKDFTTDGITFRHIATSDVAEISGHYHPKASITIKSRSISRPAFLIDKARIIMPAFGTYTGGLKTTEDPIANLMRKDAKAVMTGQSVSVLPMPR